MTKKLISFSLFGGDPTYWKGAERNLALFPAHLPDYTLRFYVPDFAPERLTRRLADRGAEIVQVSGQRSDWTATMWRFWALRDTDVSHFLFRDCDSRPSDRETAAVRAWEESGKAFHVMRDHPAHHAAMLAGMWGCTQEGAKRIRGQIPRVMQPSGDYHEHYDQGWLARCVWPEAVKDSLTHASYWTKFFGPTEPFPTPRKDQEFVAAAMDGNENPRYPDHMNLDFLCQRCSCALKCERRD